MDSSQLRLKHFVKGSEHILTNTESTSKTTLIPRQTLISGTKIREFYENAVGKKGLKRETEIKPKEESIASSLKPKAAKTPFNINLFMKAVESGKVQDVQTFLEENQERLNCKDQFGWTALMTACCVGNLHMVQMLLQWKPDVNERDKRGLNCRDLASVKGHHCIVDTIDRYLLDLNKPVKINNKEIAANKTLENSCFYCKVCKQNIENTTLKKHLSSTVHNFHSSSQRRKQTFYGIPESNKGFQILVRSGWDKEGGLGPSGVGHKYPPKTILKQDRTGLGAKKYKARVTHIVEETKPKSKHVRIIKRDLKSEKRKEQRRERNLRKLLS